MLSAQDYTQILYVHICYVCAKGQSELHIYYYYDLKYLHDTPFPTWDMLYLYYITVVIKLFNQIQLMVQSVLSQSTTKDNILVSLMMDH